MASQDYEVVVVGGGPVGAAAALALAREGFRVALVERQAAAPAFDPADYDLRMYAISAQSQQFLQQLGAWAGIAAARACAYRGMRVWQRGPEHALCFDAAEAGRAELGWIVEHSLIVQALRERLDGVDLIAGATVATVRFEAGGAALHLADGRRLQARLVLAADGADSQLRQMAGIESAGWSYAHRAIVCHVSTARPHQHIAWQRFLRSGPLAFLPLADGRSSIVWSAEPPLAAELLALDDAAFCARLAEAAEHALGEVVGTTRRIAFPLRLAHARDYVRAGLALVGDAAHVIHPMAGQGVNLGLADAQCLVCTLAAARTAGRDCWSLRTLQRYARERKAANLEMQALTEALYRGFRLPLPGLRAALGLGMEALNRAAPLKSWLAGRASRS
ncbi:MAG: FAD-dependent monooxygenase [Nevskia sp.]|nr:FAD-dependent monooxygenase [Nevskia sp.]